MSAVATPILVKLDERDETAYERARLAGFPDNAISVAIVIGNFMPRLRGCRSRAAKYAAMGRFRDAREQRRSARFALNMIRWTLSDADNPDAACACYRFLETGR